MPSSSVLVRTLVKTSASNSTLFSLFSPVFLKHTSIKYFSASNILFSRNGSSYRAAVVKKFGEPLEIQKLDRPKLKPNDVRIDVYCCGINSVDQYNLLGESDPKVDLPFVPGFEVTACLCIFSSTKSKFKTFT